MILAGCKTIQYVPVEHTKYVTVRDTTILHKTDTLVQVPEVKISDFIDVSDTLVMEASYSKAKAWVDTTARLLKGNLVQGGKLPVQIVEKERVVYKDSLVYQDKPVPVEVVKEVKYVPKVVKVLAWTGVLALLLVVAYFVKKFYKPL